MGYFQAEHLKCKRTITNKLLWIMPLLTAFLAVFMGGFYGYQYMAFYWWYTFLLPGYIAILCALAERKEQQAGNYYGVLSLPIDLGKMKWAKMIVLAEKLMFSGICLGSLVAIGNLLAPSLTVYSPIGCMLGSVGIIGASLWQIPLFHFLVRSVGNFLPVILNVILSIVLPTVLGSTTIWWLCPYCWAPKLAEGSLGILVNGTFERVEWNGSVVGISLFLSIVCFLVFSWWAANRFQGEERKL